MTTPPVSGVTYAEGSANPDVIIRLAEHTARLNALEEWQKRQNGHLADIDDKIARLEGLILYLFRQNNKVLLAVLGSIIGLALNLVVVFVRGS